ncbi:(d)CMP kinase [Hansschlegelia beijingensis]|uniref:Cytidylate kinase n=1 Tax=Hansschlegelia beijingensis TaxID=1133344 RepID=A0A7W6CYJ4_9HYPH|nr:(d)CMP kinase [Hansschlegelia beijingensis]MBB3971396.1 cytidylate kinase [Hansschlegelia beijingensis]
MIIAIDGPAASGKGTLARRLAERYRLKHLDSGVLYRAVAQRMIDLGLDLADPAAAAKAAREIDPARFDDPALRSRRTGEGASIVSAVPEVRAALLDFQRRFAAEPPGAVIDGRDIGTVICPDADVKLFVIASPEERARRRALELTRAGEPVDEAAILLDIRARDERDMNRATAPLKPAEDAIRIDTTTLDADAAFDAAVSIIERRMAERPAGADAALRANA